MLSSVIMIIAGCVKSFVCAMHTVRPRSVCVRVWMWTSVAWRLIWFLPMWVWIQATPFHIYAVKLMLLPITSRFFSLSNFFDFTSLSSSNTTDRIFIHNASASGWISSFHFSPRALRCVVRIRLSIVYMLRRVRVEYDCVRKEVWIGNLFSFSSHSSSSSAALALAMTLVVCVCVHTT